MRQFKLKWQIHDHGHQPDANHRTRRRQLANKVRLTRPASQNGIRPRILHLSNQILQLATLVSAQGKAREVVPFDPKINAQVLRHSVQPVQGRRSLDQRKSSHSHLPHDICHQIP
jgi:hypothetical protein